MQPLLFDGGRHVLHARGDGARAAAVREGVDLRKARPPREGAGGGKIRFRLAREARDDVRRDGGVGEGGAHEGDAGQELLPRVMAVHPFEHRVRPALQREVEVGRKTAHLCGGVQQAGGDNSRLERAEADARGRVLDGEQKVGEIPRPVPIGRDVDAGDDDLLRGGGEDLRRRAPEGAGAGAAAQIGDDAVGTEVVAAVLDLDEGARALRPGDGHLVVGGVRPVDADAARAFFKQRDQFALAPRARNEEHPLLFGKGGGGALGGAAAHGDARRRTDGADARDGLAGLLFRLRRDRAGVEDVQVGRFELFRDLPAPRAQRAGERRALAFVDLAAQRKDDRLHPNSPKR